MSELEQNKEDSRYKFEEYLVGCDEAIEKYMTYPDGVYYRLSHNPIIENDELPNPLQKWDNLAGTTEELKHQIEENSPIETQWIQVQGYSPSYFISDDALAKFFIGELHRRKTQRQKEKLLERKGDTIIAVKLTPNDGRISSPDEKGHVVFAPYKDFKLEEHQDKTWEPKKLLDYNIKKNE